jgi:clathrin heavy chain
LYDSISPAAKLLQGILRTLAVIESFKQALTLPGALSPILQYFGILLEKGELNHLESLEPARAVLQQGRKQFLEKWPKESRVRPFLSQNLLRQAD